MSRGHEGSNETVDTCIEIQRVEDVQLFGDEAVINRTMDSYKELLRHG